ncbi:hypothetical protein [Poriferisphaera sp. WC338]|uniref:hypothetical protein n=1 Tax=Poriferisphaera sp. WC338 TaxID=3425129 RepID=UPI003D813633
MKRIQIASYVLLASAFVMAALLVSTLDKDIAINSTAEAQYLISRDNFTLMTADIRSGEQGLFVLDNTKGKLLVYRTDVSRKQMVLADQLDLRRLFRGVGGGEHGGQGEGGNEQPEQPRR